MSVELKDIQDLKNVDGEWLTSRLRQPAIVAIALALLAIGCYWGIGRNQFVDYDDQVYITKNYNLDRGFTPLGIAWAFSTLTAQNYHPITWLSHMLDLQLFGRDAAWHHRMNVLFHAANTVLLFLVLMRLTQRQWPSAFVAALFAVHPLNVESVAWAAERKNLLSTLFFLLTLWAYCRYVEVPSKRRYAVVATMMLLGLLSKPMLVTLPFVLLLLDYWPLDRVGAEPRLRRERAFLGRWIPLVIEKLPLLALSLLSSILTLAIQTEAQTSLAVLPLGQRIANALVSYAAYLVKFVWPWRLAVLYPHPRAGVPIWQVMLSLIVLIAITAAVWRIGKTRRYLRVGWFWYLGTLVPVIGMVQVGSHAMADRYTYLPLIGIMIIVAWGFAEASVGWPRRSPVLGGAAAVALLALFLLTIGQVRAWQTTGTLFANALRVNPNNDVAHFHVANDLLQRGRLTEALAHYREAVRLSPGDEEFVLGLAAAWRRNRQYDEALAMLNRWIADHPRSLLAIDERGKLLIDKGDLDDAAKDFQAIAAAPATAENERIRAAAMRNLGLVYARQGNKGLALKQFEEALLLDPAHCDTHLSAGLIELDQQRYDKAAAHFKEAVRSNPQSMEAHYRLAQTLVKQGHPKQAVANLRDLVAVRADNPIAHFYLAQLLIDQHQLRDGLVELSEAVRLRPDWNLAANELAWYLATTNDLHLRNGARAVPLAEGVCQRTKYSLPSYLDTLAAAYAAAGQFEQAEKTAVRAKEAAIKQGDTNLAARIEQRQRLYAVGQPYRDPLH